MDNSINQEIIHLLKTGVDPQIIQQRIAEESKKAYSQDFVSFMQDMLVKYKVKRNEVARQTGISQDYLYKVLNGSKKSAEKDYIVAICIAIGMNVPETQHALAINSMPLLNDRDLREHILLDCLSEHRNIRRTDDMLDSAGFPLLKTSKDMETYIPTIDFVPESEMTGTIDRPKRKRYREISREVFAEQNGNAPFDYVYWANITVEDDEQHRFYVQGFFHQEFTIYSVLNEENYLKYQQWVKTQPNTEDIKFDTLTTGFEELCCNAQEHDDKSAADWDLLESYEDLDDAFDSDFLRFFIETDRITDEKVKEVYKNICDTKNYGTRFGIKSVGEQMISYAEQYDAAYPEANQYFQIIETDGNIVYTASHESVFLWIEMDEFYNAVFGEREDPKYYIHIDNEKDLFNIPNRDRFIFNSLKADLHHFMKDQAADLVKTDNLQIIHEDIESYAELAAWSAMHGDYKKSLDINMVVLEMANDCEKNYGTDELPIIISTLSKISICHSNLGNTEESRKWAEKILTYKTRIYEFMERDSKDIGAALSIYSEELIIRAQHAQNDGDAEKLKEYTKEVIQLIEPRCTEEIAESLFIAYIKYAYQLDEENNAVGVRRFGPFSVR